MVNPCAVTVAARNTYDHRLRNLVAAVGTTAVNDLALPRSTVATWRRKGHLSVVSSGVFEEADVAVRAKLVRLERRLAVMRSLLCLLLVLGRTCPKQQPSKLTFAEEHKMRELVESNDLRHFSIRALAMHARRIGALFASGSTWWRTIHEKGWMRPKQRVHPESPKVRIRASRIGEMLHVDVTVIRLLDGTKVFLQAVMDNFSRRILSWRVSPALEP